MAKKNNSSNDNNKNFQRHFRKFRFAKFTGHPQYVYDDDGNEYKVIGITESPVTNGVDNIPLDVNPEPGRTDKSYIRPKADKVNKGVRSVKLKGWHFAASDKPKVQKVIDDDGKRKKKKPRK